MKNIILFDFDGVIIQSEPVIKAAFTLSYQDLINDEVAPPVEEYLSHMGESFGNIMEKMKLPQKMYEVFCHYSNRLVNLIELVEGFTEILDLLKNSSKKIGLVTGKDRKRTIDILGRLQIIQYFDVIVAGDDVKHPKPHAEPILKAVSECNGKHSEAIMIGDSPNDIIAARNANIESCAVLWGIGKTDELFHENPQFIVRDPGELSVLLKQIISQPQFKY
ncbi:HAD family hydrolase [Paenibacillus stellifer]|uniref:HAD family hydrolase n=1 Tax=Paenibacillus stellifer TaxID=169760 RepID=UPI0006916D89|nr:HAD-IA family hydrolase [Paenibacillus stellifer]